MPTSKWHCLGCKKPFGEVVEGPTLGDAGGLVLDVLVCCGCGTPHLPDGGGLRLLTAGERFAFELMMPDEPFTQCTQALYGSPN